MKKAVLTPPQLGPEVRSCGTDPVLDAKTDQWFRKAWEKTGRKLDGGKRLERGEDLVAVGCIRFRRLEDVPLEVVGELIARTPVANYIARIESVFESRTAKGSKSKVRAAKR